MSCDVLNRLPDSWQDLRESVVYGFGKVAINFSVGCIVD